MAETVTLGQIAFGEPLIPSGFYANDDEERLHSQKYGGGQKLSSLATRPQYIIRPDYWIDQSGLESYYELIDEFRVELDFIESELGLHAPGLSIAQEPLVSVTQPFLVARRIEGLNLDTELDQVPEHIALDACVAIITYYDGALERGPGLRLWDLALRQLVYGKAFPQDLEPKLFMVDVDAYVHRLITSDNGEVSQIHNGGLISNAIPRISGSVDALERTFGKKYPGLQAYAEKTIAKLGKYKQC